MGRGTKELLVTESGAQQGIVLLTLVTVGSTSSAYLIGTKTKPQINEKTVRKTIVGGFAAMLLCSMLAEADPLAGISLALLISGGVFIKYGLPSLTAYYKEGKKK